MRDATQEFTDTSRPQPPALEPTQHQLGTSPLEIKEFHSPQAKFPDQGRGLPIGPQDLLMRSAGRNQVEKYG